MSHRALSFTAWTYFAGTALFIVGGIDSVCKYGIRDVPSLTWLLGSCLFMLAHLWQWLLSRTGADASHSAVAAATEAPA